MNIKAEKNALAASLGVSIQRMSQAYLRVERSLGTDQSISFDPNKTNSVANVVEKLLSQNDKFIVTHVGIAIKKCADTPAGHAVARLYTYLNENVFSQANDANIQAVYNGSLKIQRNETVYVPGLDARSFERVPTSQEGTVTAAITGPTTYSTGRDGFENGLFGYYPIDPFIISGDEKNEFTLNLPTSVNMAATSNANFVVLLLKGYLLQG